MEKPKIIVMVVTAMYANHLYVTGLDTSKKILEMQDLLFTKQPLKIKDGPEYFIINS